MDLINEFIKTFKNKPTHKASSYGRFEVLGNHTDHNHGLCIAATCDLSIETVLKANDDNHVRFNSIGYGFIDLDLSDLDKKDDECASTSGLIRGIARYFKEHGANIGGFDATSISHIFPGAGVSSSAAFESLIGEIFNYFYNDDKLDKLFIAKAGQYAENTDFGKSSGLLDQIGCGYGNLSFIDFKDIANPLVEKIEFPFANLQFVIVNTGGSHANLSHLYSSIPTDMWNAAKKMGHNYLRDCESEDDPSLTTIERERARHFFSENRRVIRMKECLLNKDEQGFLDCINESRLSSTNNLKNMMVGSEYTNSPLEATDLAMELMDNKGACKINGGGFAGSIICVVPLDKLNHFLTEMKKKYGEHNVALVSINKHGPIVEKL